MNKHTTIQTTPPTKAEIKENIQLRLNALYRESRSLEAALKAFEGLSSNGAAENEQTTQARAGTTRETTPPTVRDFLRLLQQKIGKEEFGTREVKEMLESFGWQLNRGQINNLIHGALRENHLNIIVTGKGRRRAVYSVK